MNNLVDNSFNPPLISPSILACDFMNIGKEITSVLSADMLHIDVMDGLFVPNITIGQPIVSAIGELVKDKVQRPKLDVHLMIEAPERYIQDFAEAGSDIITVHLEATRHLHSLIEKIKSHQIGAGVAINPHSGVELLEDVLPMLDLVLIMGVNTGFGGQKLIAQTYKKLEKLKKLAPSNLIISVDGGVTQDNIRRLFQAGANTFVAGTGVFRESDRGQAIWRLKQACYQEA